MKINHPLINMQPLFLKFVYNKQKIPIQLSKHINRFLFCCKYKKKKEICFAKARETPPFNTYWDV